VRNKQDSTFYGMKSADRTGGKEKILRDGRAMAKRLWRKTHKVKGYQWFERDNHRKPREGLGGGEEVLGAKGG